jgi:prolyl-tRNA synthetase
MAARAQPGGYFDVHPKPISPTPPGTMLLHSRPMKNADTTPGAIARWTQTLIPTARQAPADAETPSHIFLTRAGYIRKVTAGVYAYLPLGYRVLRKIEAIVRQEMDATGASELLLPALMPLDLLKPTGRDQDYGDLLFTLKDRHGRDQFLGPTHEEVITETLKTAVNSYKALPLSVYQIQTKYRDEFRPRAGLLRCREFIMKDAYSFHASGGGMKQEGGIAETNTGGLDETYDRMYQAYTNIFTRCGLDFTVVEAEAGPIGGSASHEFMVNAETGEDTILVCPETGYAANVEKAEIGNRPEPEGGYFTGEPTGDLDTVHTPECPGIDDVCKLMKVKPANMLKTVVFKAEGGKVAWVLACVRGDQDVNEGKVRDAAGCNIAIADIDEAKAAGFAIGYVSPKAAAGRDDTLLLVDPDAAVGFDAAKGKPMFWVTGADKPDHHVKHFNWQREMPEGTATVASIRNAAAGDPSPKAQGAILEARRGIEVGHIFKLGDKYSKAMGFEILDAEGNRTPVIMGCYGIGVSRTIAACVEQSSDDHGIIWPAPIAPYHILITLIKPDEPTQTAANALAADLAAAGFDVLIDDRDERPGVKFNDADLIGIPVRVTIGAKALAENSVELKARTDPGKGTLVPIADAVARCEALLAC